MPQKTEKTKRGAPRGNQNARKHGFYSRVLDDDEQLDLKLAVCVDGLDEEIALLRTKIKAVLRHDPDNFKLIMQAMAALARLVRTRCNISQRDKQGLKEAIANVLRDVALPLGIIKATFDK